MTIKNEDTYNSDNLHLTQHWQSILHTIHNNDNFDWTQHTTVTIYTEHNTQWHSTLNTSHTMTIYTDHITQQWQFTLSTIHNNDNLHWTCTSVTIHTELNTHNNDNQDIQRKLLCMFSAALSLASFFLSPLPSTPRPPRWPSGKASASSAEDPGFKSRLRRDFFGVQSYQWLKNWHSSGYPARRLALQGQRWDWSARCQYTVTWWGRKLDLKLLSQCGSTVNCLCRSVPEIH